MIEHKVQRNNALYAEEKILTTCRYLATWTVQQNISTCILLVKRRVLIYRIGVRSSNMAHDYPDLIYHYWEVTLDNFVILEDLFLPKTIEKKCMYVLLERASMFSSFLLLWQNIFWKCCSVELMVWAQKGSLLYQLTQQQAVESWLVSCFLDVKRDRWFNSLWRTSISVFRNGEPHPWLKA